MKTGIINQRRGTVVETRKNITFKLDEDEEKPTLVTKRLMSAETFGMNYQDGSS
jgi:hypothetical protein